MIFNKTERTQAILAAFKGLPGEFYMLKGLLVVGDAVSDAAMVSSKHLPMFWQGVMDERTHFNHHYDGVELAKRMDEIFAKREQEPSNVFILRGVKNMHEYVKFDEIGSLPALTDELNKAFQFKTKDAAERVADQWLEGYGYEFDVCEMVPVGSTIRFK